MVSISRLRLLLSKYQHLRPPKKVSISVYTERPNFESLNLNLENETKEKKVSVLNENVWSASLKKSNPFYEKPGRVDDIVYL